MKTVKTTQISQINNNLIKIKRGTHNKSAKKAVLYMYRS